MRMKKHLLAFTLALTLLATTSFSAVAAPVGQVGLTPGQIDAARYRSTISAQFETLAVKNGNALEFWGGSKSDGPANQRLLTGVARIDTPYGVLWVEKTDHSLWGYEYGWMIHPTWYIEGITAPAPIKVLDNIVEYDGYGDMVVATLSDNSLWMAEWRYVTVYGEGAESTKFVQVQNGPYKVSDHVLHVSVAHDYVYAIKDDQALYRWEIAKYRVERTSPGTHMVTQLQGEPEKVMDNVVWVDGENRLLITADNTLWGWGEQDLKDAAQSWTKVDSRTGSLTYEAPTPLMTDVVKACYGIALKTDGSIWTWGDSDYGALGNGVATIESRRSDMKQYEPIQIVASGGRDVGGGAKHHVYLLSDGTLWGMGDNGVYAFGRAGGNFLTSYGDWFQTVPVKIGSSCLLPV